MVNVRGQTWNVMRDKVVYVEGHWWEGRFVTWQLFECPSGGEVGQLVSEKVSVERNRQSSGQEDCVYMW